MIEPREEFFYLPDGKALRVIAIPHALGGILFAYEDVTDRLALERSYNTLIAVQRETLDNLHEGVAVFGEDGRLKLINPVYLAMWDIDAEWRGRTAYHGFDRGTQATCTVFEDWDAFRDEQVERKCRAARLSRTRIERKDGKVIDCARCRCPTARR